MIFLIFLLNLNVFLVSFFNIYFKLLDFQLKTLKARKFQVKHNDDKTRKSAVVGQYRLDGTLNHKDL